MPAQHNSITTSQIILERQMDECKTKCLRIMLRLIPLQDVISTIDYVINSRQFWILQNVCDIPYRLGEKTSEYALLIYLQLFLFRLMVHRHEPNIRCVQHPSVIPHWPAIEQPTWWQPKSLQLLMLFSPNPESISFQIKESKPFSLNTIDLSFTRDQWT